MKVLFIHQYFRTPEEGGGIRSYYMCKALVNAGHEVEVVTAFNGGKSFYKTVEGIKVNYLSVYYDNRLGFAGRSYAFVKFLVLAIIRSLKTPKPDICYASSSPLTVGVIAIVLKKVKKVPFIFEVMDLWPEAPIQMGFVKNPLLIGFLKWLEKKIYNDSKLIVAASPGMAEGVKAVAPQKEVITVPNMSDCEYFKPSERDDQLCNKYGVKGKFVCCYTGAIGLSNNLEVLINVAAYLKNNQKSNVHFLIAGEGASLPGLKLRSRELELDNISFLGHVGKKEISEIYDVSRINLIIFNKQPILATNSPNKFFDGLAAGLPAVVNLDGWIKEICEKEKCGKRFHSENPYEFLQIIEEFEIEEISKEYSINARQVAEQKFNKNILLKDFLSLFEQK